MPVKYPNLILKFWWCYVAGVLLTVGVIAGTTILGSERLGYLYEMVNHRGPYILISLWMGITATVIAGKSFLISDCRREVFFHVRIAILCAFLAGLSGSFVGHYGLHKSYEREMGDNPSPEEIRRLSLLTYIGKKQAFEPIGFGSFIIIPAVCLLWCLSSKREKLMWTAGVGSKESFEKNWALGSDHSK